LIAASATFALKAGVWFRRGRLLVVSPDSRAIACQLSGRNSTYRRVQISGAGSVSHIKNTLDAAAINVRRGTISRERKQRKQAESADNHETA